MYFESWQGLLRIFLVGVPAYLGLVLLLRVSGKRTLSKMNAFDLVVTVALGSTLATTLLSRDVPLVEGLGALALLIGLQYVITWSSVRSARFKRLVRSEPSLLYFRGETVHGELRRERVSVEELHQAVRDSGFASLAEVDAVVLETDGTTAVIPKGERGEWDALGPVRGSKDREKLP